MVIPGTLDEWRSSTGLPFDESGPVVVPGAACRSSAASSMTTRSTSSRRCGCTSYEPGPGRPDKPNISRRSLHIPTVQQESLFGDLLPMWNIHVYTASSAGARCAMLGGGGIGEQEASAVTGGGGTEEQVTAVSGGGGTDEQDASAVGGGGIAQHEASAVTGSSGRQREASAVTGGGGIAEHEASAVTGPAGSESTRPARLPAAAVSRNSPAPYSAAAGYLIPDGPGGEPGPTRLGSHRTPYPYSAADCPSGSLPRRPKTPVLAQRALPTPRPRSARLPGAAPDRRPGTVDSGAFSGPASRRGAGRRARRHPPGISPGPRARSSASPSGDRAASAGGCGCGGAGNWTSIGDGPTTVTGAGAGLCLLALGVATCLIGGRAPARVRRPVQR